LVLSYSFSSTPFQWVELNGDPSANVVIGYGDDWANPIDLGSNTIRFYGNTFTGANNIWASTNGILTFGSGFFSFTNGDLITNPGQATISPLWDDYYKPAGGSPMMLSKIVNNELIVEWNQVLAFVTTRPITFEAIIQLNTGDAPGNITFSYLQLDYYKGSAASVGIKDGGSPAPSYSIVSISQVNPLVDVNQSILFSWDSPNQIPVLSFLSTNSASEGSGDLTLTVNGSNFAAGATVQINGTSFATTDLSSTQLQVTLPKSLFAEEGSFNVSVLNPGSTGGTSGSVPFSVTDAALTPSGQLLSGIEGQSLSNALVATFTDPGTDSTAADYTATVTWDDGNGQSHTSTGTIQWVSGTTFNVYADNTIPYAEEGVHGVTVTINDVGGSQATVTSEVKVLDAALTASAIIINSTEGAIFSGPVATFSDTDPAGALSDYSATINWGDGQSSTGAITSGAGGTYLVSGSHTYTEDGAFTVSVSIADVGGANVTTSGSANVSDASLSGQGTSITATEGALFSGTIATFNDANMNAPASDFTVLIDWGDGLSSPGLVSANGNGQFTVTGSHTYLEEGNFKVGVSITDEGGSSTSASSTAAVSDALLSASGLTVNPIEGNTFIGVVASFIDADPNGMASDYQATIDWGDGTTSPGTIQVDPSGGFDVVGTHSFAEEGTTNVTVTIQDLGGNHTMTTANSTAVTGDAPLAAKGVIATATEGAVFSGTIATFTDADEFANPGDYVVTITWGDGTTDAGAVVANPGGGFLVTGTHTYTEEGSQSVSVTILDDGNSSASVTSTMIIGDATLSASGTTVKGTEGASLTGPVATFSDANSFAVASDFTATINWGDGISTTGTVASDGSGGFVVTGSHTYAEDGNYSLMVTISDKGGAGTSASSSAQVADAALTAMGSPVSAVEGSAFSGVVATFTDADPNGTASDFSAVITWGDGHTSNGTITSNSNGGFSVSGVNTYAEEGPYTIGVQIKDAGGSSTNSSSTATVADASIQGTSVTISTIEGSSFTGTVATFVDSYTAGQATDFSATISWGDGSNTPGSIIPLGNGQYAVRGSHTYTDEGKFSVGVQISDSGKASASATSSANVTDAALSATVGSISTVEGTSFSGTVASFQDANSAANLADFSATISWGDGSSSPGTITPNLSGGYLVSGSHIYNAEGAHSFSVTITDDGGATATVNGTASVAEAALSANGTSLTEIQGLSFNALLATFNDAFLQSSPGEFTAVVSWGDGSSNSLGTINQNGPGSFSVLGSHTYSVAGNYSISVQIIDGTTSATANSTAHVLQVGMMGTGTTIHATEGVPFTAVVANFSNANSSLTPASFSAVINWSDGTTSAGVITGNSATGYSVTGTHAFGSTGTKSLTVVIQDSAGQWAQAISTVIVADFIPLIQAHVHHHEHQHHVTLTGTFFDAASEDHEVVVNWGDGTTSVLDLGISRTSPFSLDHQYSGHFLAEHGGRVRVTVTVIDDDGESSAPLVFNLKFDNRHEDDDEGNHGLHLGEDNNLWDIPGINFFS
jgi:hypothetical protein